MREISDGVGSIFVKLCRQAVRHTLPLIPKTTAGLMAITLLHDGGMPALTTDIIWGTVPDGDAKEDVIVDPSGDGANPLSPKNVQGGIADLAVNAPG